MAETLLNIENQISLISLSEQISLMAFLANIIKHNSETNADRKSFVSKRLGIAKGKFSVDDNIDSCNDEIAQMFGVV